MRTMSQAVNCHGQYSLLKTRETIRFSINSTVTGIQLLEKKNTGLQIGKEGVMALECRMLEGWPDVDIRPFCSVSSS